MQSISQWWIWAGFIIFIVIILFLDLFLFGGKKASRVSMKESLNWVIIWVSLALLFNLLLWIYLTHRVGSHIANQKALEFFTGYLIEWSLSIDNMFVFISIFNYFKVPFEYQRRVLLYGVLSAIVMRLTIIVIGVYLVKKFHWILYLFGIVLIYTGIKMLVFSDEKTDFNNNPIIRFIRKHLRVTEEYHLERFFVRLNNVYYVTPLFMVLAFIEISDLIFALDSIPVIFGITEDPFIIFTSNIFAILGLRSLYFLLANMTNMFYYLKQGIALILIFIGFKMLIAWWFKLTILYALTVVIFILIASIMLSIFKKN